MRSRALLITAAAVLVAAAPAPAAEPESGTVSAASPTVEWTGNASGYGVVPTNILVTATGEDPVCPPEACDTFTLTVADQADLVVTAQQTAGDNFTELHVIKPDGEVLYGQSADSAPISIKVKNAPKGDYTIEVMTNETMASSGEYNASAVLKVPAPATAAPAPAPATTAPAPAAPAEAPAATLSLKTTKLSAKRARKSAKLAVVASSPVTGLQAVLKKGSATVGKARAASLNGKKTLTFKLRKKLKPGVYTLAMVAKDGARTVGLTTRLKVTR